MQATSAKSTKRPKPNFFQVLLQVEFDKLPVRSVFRFQPSRGFKQSYARATYKAAKTAQQSTPPLSAFIKDGVDEATANANRRLCMMLLGVQERNRLLGFDLA